MDRLACVDLPGSCRRILGARDSRQGGVISTQEIAAAREHMLERLRRFSPEVEPVAVAAAFWLGATGLEKLHGSLERWASRIRADLRAAGFTATVVVGFTRFGTYALARSGRGTIVLSSPAAEAENVRQVTLDRLDLAPVLIGDLARLGVRTVGDLAALPRAGLLERFGPDIERVHRLAAGVVWDPLRPTATSECRAARIDLDEPDADAVRLTFLAKQLLDPLLQRAAADRCAVVELELGLTLHRVGERCERLRPAAPTLDGPQLTDLLRLRLESLPLDAGVVALALVLNTVAAEEEQLKLFAARPRRDPLAAERAFAQLRAEFGPGSVVRAAMAEGHLPEARFSFTPLTAPLLGPCSSSPPHPGRNRTGAWRTLVRRIYARPVPLQTRPVVGPCGCHLQGLDGAPAGWLNGPYIVSGGWWAKAVHREYYFAEAADGRILWVYFDRQRRSWFLHGEVE